MRNCFTARLLPILILILSCSVPVSAQSKLRGSVKGSVIDSVSGQPLEFVSISIKNLSDSFVVQTTASAKDGSFIARGMPEGKYELWFSFIGYKTLKTPFSITEKDSDLNLGNILFVPGIDLKEVVVQGERAPITVKKDTVEYNAGSFKTQPNDNAEELLKKLPGIEVDKDGKITAQGKTVNKVLVDGKEFFGNDPKAATKNLPADAINKVQLIDDKTENSKNTGIDDGQREKVLNLTIKDDKKKGWFGNAALAGGSSERYLGQLNMNHFNKDKQLSFLMMTNNVNQSGFSWEELSNFSGGDPNTAFGSSDGSIRINVNRNGSSDINGVFSGVGSGGLINTHSGGLNFSNNYGKNKQLKINGSYVAVLSSNTISRISDIQDPLANELIYTSQLAYGENKNDIHRLNFGMDYKPDSLTRIQFKPGFSITSKNTLADQNYMSVNQASTPVNSGLQYFNQESTSPALGGQFTTNRLLRGGKGSVNLTVNGNYNNSDLNYFNRSLTQFTVAGTVEEISFDQHSDQQADRSFVNGSLSFVRLLNKENKLSLTMKNTYQYSDDIANQVTLEYNPVTGLYETLVPSLSNNFNNQNWRNTIAAGLNMAGKSVTWNVNAAAAYLGLSGAVSGNNLALVERSSLAFVPDASISYRQKNGRSLYASINSTVNMPGVSSLQPVFNNTNPLYIRNGNPDLDMSRSVNANLNYNFFDTKNSSYISLYSSFSQIWNGFSTASIVDPNSRIQTVTSINTDGNYNFNVGFSTGKPSKIKGLRFRLNSSASSNRNINYINTFENQANRISGSLSGGINYTKDRFAVNLDLSSTYNNVRNSVQTLSNQEYFNFNNYFSISGEPIKKLRIFTDLNQILYSGTNSNSLNNNFILMNAGIERFFMKNRQLTLSLIAFDLLNQNSNMQRSITATGRIEDFRTNNLNRYAYLKLNYKLQRIGVPKQQSGGIINIR